jgi:glycosyltransferase involved in cell wall biosynthesis
MGRLAPEKGFDQLIRAFANCAPKHSEWSLVILGEGGERAHLEGLAVSLGVAARVHLLGQVREPVGVLRRADLFVLSSAAEGWPNALAEAMASGLPVISFDCAGSCEIVRDHLDGVLVRRHGDAGALALAMDRLMSDEGERERLGRHALGITERFGVEGVVKLWEELFEVAAGVTSRPAGRQGPRRPSTLPSA